MGISAGHRPSIKKPEVDQDNAYNRPYRYLPTYCPLKRETDAAPVMTCRPGWPRTGAFRDPFPFSFSPSQLPPMANSSGGQERRPSKSAGLRKRSRPSRSGRGWAPLRVAAVVGLEGRVQLLSGNYFPSSFSLLFRRLLGEEASQAMSGTMGQGASKRCTQASGIFGSQVRVLNFVRRVRCLAREGKGKTVCLGRESQ